MTRIYPIGVKLRESLAGWMKKSYSIFSPIGGKLGIDEYCNSLYNHIRPDKKSIEFQGTTGTFNVQHRRDRNYISGFSDKSLADLIDNIHEDDVVYNIGAHIGVHAIFIANNLSKGEIIAFEPHPVNAERLRNNVGLNRGKIKVVEKVVSDETGDIEFHVKSLEEQVGTHNIVTGSEKKTISRESVTGDEIVADNDYPKPNIISIDVEGAELRVVEGFRETLRDTDCRAVYIEVHQPKEEQEYEMSRTSSIKDFGDSPEELHETLIEMGFTIERLEDMGDRYSIKAIKKKN